jgi:hypothetical protein
MAAVLYLYDQEPFDEMAGTILTKIRRPLLKGTEWLDRHDVDPESLVLELPPDMIFGPLEFEQQMKFLLAALDADNELADGYVTRLIVDHMDISLDPPLLAEQRVLDAGGLALLDFAVRDFTEARKPRKHCFFTADAFLRLVNWFAPYPRLAEVFVRDYNGVDLIFEALKFSKDDYARVLAMRSLCLFCFQQKNDGDVERRILQANAVKQIVDSYKQSSGDPTDTRYLTILLSSLMRHFPAEGGREFLDADGVQAAVNNLNIGRYKGFPQHLRVLHDAQRLPAKAIGAMSVNERIIDADFTPVAFGIMDAFPEYYEVMGDMLQMMYEMLPNTTPFHFMEYRAFPVLSKVYVRYMNDPVFQTDGTRKLMARFVQKMYDDPTCQRCMDPTVASYELQAAMKTLNDLLEADRTNRVTQSDSPKQ